MQTEPAHAMLLAAGLSTRLAGLSDERPKPLFPVCNHPLILWAADLCVHHGITDLAVNLHHLGPMIRDELRDGAGLGASVIYSEEPEILGTGGGIRAMAALMPERTCVVINAKIVCDVDLHGLLLEHGRSGALATMLVREDPNAEQWGAIALEDDGRIARILDAQRPGAGPSCPRMFTGIHAIEPELVRHIPGGPCCVIRTAYQELLRRGAPLRGVVHRGYFYDHSTPARYLQGNFNLLGGRIALAHRRAPHSGVAASASVSRSATLVPPFLVGDGATIGDGAIVGPRAVIGPRARVHAGARVSDSVAWADAEVRSSVRRAIVTPRRVVEVPDLGDPAARPR